MALTMGTARTANQNVKLGTVNPAPLTMGTANSAGWNLSPSVGAADPTGILPWNDDRGYGGVTQTPAAPARPSRAQTDPLLASLASLDQILFNRNAQTDAEYERAIKGYSEQDRLDRVAYDDNVRQNEQTLTANNQRALLNAANGGSGLRGVLSSLGGLAGSGMDVIQRLVGLAANADTGAARETFDTNAGNLTQSWGRAEQQQRQRREDAGAIRENNRQNNEAGVLTSKQSIYQQLANLFGAGDAEGMNYASKASSLAAPIAATSRATVAPYAAASSSFSPAALQEYLGGTQNLQVNTAAGSDSGTVPVNSPLYPGRKKEQLVGVA